MYQSIQSKIGVRVKILDCSGSRHCSPSNFYSDPNFVLPGLREGTSMIVLGSDSGRTLVTELAYRLHGPSQAPVVVALGGISAGPDVQQWWQDLYGAGHALDPQHYRILGMDWFGGRWGDGQCVSTDEQAQILAGVLDHLRINRVRLLVGASYGAMVGLAFAARYHERLDELLAISGAHRAHPMAVARRQIQRDIVRLGESAGRAEDGLVLARALALTTYRPAALFEEQFDDLDPQRVAAAIAAYFDHQGSKFLASFDAARYCSLSESLDLHQVTPERVCCPVTLVGVDTDELVPCRQLNELAARLGRRCRLQIIHSRYGHDAFLKEPELFNELIRSVLAEERDHEQV